MERLGLKQVLIWGVSLPGDGFARGTTTLRPHVAIKKIGIVFRHANETLCEP